MPTQKKALKKPKPKTNSILPKGGMSPKAGISPNISTIPQDILLKILDSAFNFSNKLDNDLIFAFIKLMSNVSKTNKDFRNSVSSIVPSWNNITIINLQNLKITNKILDVLKMTNEKNITTIVLRNILFDNDETCNNFLEFLSKNTKTKNLIFDNVKVETEKFLIKLKTFKNLQWLEISRCNLTQYDFDNFIKILLYSKNLLYLTLTNNIIWEGFHNYLFTKNKNNENLINNIYYIIYVLKENNSWSMIIKDNNETLINNFEINIINNDIEGKYGVNINLRNDFVKYIKFLE
jgi:hypothetical protein